MAYPVGLRDLYFAKQNADGTYVAPRKIKEAISAKIKPNFQITTLYGDDRAVVIAEALGDIDIALDVTDLTPDDYAYIMGITKNTDGVVEDSINTIAPYGAIMFRLPLNEGGFRYYCYYRGKFSSPDLTHTTKGGKSDFQTTSVSGKFMPRSDGKWRAHVDSTDVGVSQTVIDNWFTTVYVPTA